MSSVTAEFPSSWAPAIEKTIEEVLRLSTTRMTRLELEQNAISGYRAAKACDLDNNGTMSSDEILQLSRRLGLPVSDGDDAIGSMDADGSGVLEISEFVQWWIKRCAAVPGTYINARKTAAIDFTSDQKEKIRHAITSTLEDPKNLSSAAELTQQANAAFRAAKASDRDGNEIITTAEIEELTQMLGLPMGDADEMIVSLDEDGSGRLEIMEFVVWWIKRVSRFPGTDKQQEVIAKNVFKKFDKNHSGTITSEELRDIVSSLGVDFSDSELREALEELDTDRSGCIDQNEFLEWWMNRANSVRPGASLIAYKLKNVAQKAAQVFYTDIHTASWKGNLELVKMFLDATPLLCNAGDTNEGGDGWTPLQYACYQGHSDVVAEILSRTNDKNGYICTVDQTNDLGFTALFYAAQRQYLDICRMLLERGADPSICGSHHMDPDVRLCAADHAQDSEELREIFLQHHHCVPPLEVNAEDLYGSINTSGLVVIELPSLKSVLSLSVLPLTKWRFRLTISGTMPSKILEVAIGATRAKIDQRQKCEIELNKGDASIFLLAAQNGNFGISAAAQNAIGEGPFSTSVSVLVSTTTPRRVSKGGTPGSASVNSKSGPR